MHPLCALALAAHHHGIPMMSARKDERAVWYKTINTSSVYHWKGRCRGMHPLCALALAAHHHGIPLMRYPMMRYPMMSARKDERVPERTMMSARKDERVPERTMMSARKDERVPERTMQYITNYPMMRLPMRYPPMRYPMLCNTIHNKLLEFRIIGRDGAEACILCAPSLFCSASSSRERPRPQGVIRTGCPSSSSILDEARPSGCVLNEG
jgi:hypothetical protein